MDNSIPSSFRLLLVPGLVFATVLFLGPLVLMLSLSVREAETGIENFDWMLGSSAVQSIAWATVRFSALASTISVVLGFFLAYAIWRSGRILGTSLLAVVLISFWLSVLVRCFSLILMLGPNGPVLPALAFLGLGDVRLIRNESGVLIGMAHYLIPFAVLTILISLRAIDLSLVSAARSMGAGRGRIFRTIILPLAVPGTIAAFSLCFVIALGFYITPALLGGGRVVMIAEFVTFYISDILDWGKASALAILLLVLIGFSYAVLRLAQSLFGRARAA